MIEALGIPSNEHRFVRVIRAVAPINRQGKISAPDGGEGNGSRLICADGTGIIVEALSTVDGGKFDGLLHHLTVPVAQNATNDAASVVFSSAVVSAGAMAITSHLHGGNHVIRGGLLPHRLVLAHLFDGGHRPDLIQARRRVGMIVRIRTAADGVGRVRLAPAIAPVHRQRGLSINGRNIGQDRRRCLGYLAAGLDVERAELDSVINGVLARICEFICC
mmetsp:Transcript_33651/g.99160  ORF Transcript_33651/g.99160 Transcript_33651/m.99160 type:complete len:219 (+) Transcript_33651:1041-1697(+)